MKADANLPQRILDAALDIVETQGVKALTQPRLAKATGLRQSHLTYYFPRKADLLVALLQRSHERAASRAASETPKKAAPLTFLRDLMFDRNRVRFFLAIVIEASEDSELRKILAAHARAPAELVAPLFNRSADDPDVIAFIDLLRGVSLRMLLESGQENPPDLEQLAARCGLQKAAAGR